MSFRCPARRGDVQWKTLISAGLTPTGALTAGVARLSAEGRLQAHRHDQAEIYLILEGAGTVIIDGATSEVAAGMTVFIPGARSTRSRPRVRPGCALPMCSTLIASRT
jgi:gentisate 1,2-dioxygenase